MVVTDLPRISKFRYIIALLVVTRSFTICVYCTDILVTTEDASCTSHNSLTVTIRERYLARVAKQWD